MEGVETQMEPKAVTKARAFFSFEAVGIPLISLTIKLVIIITTIQKPYLKSVILL